MSGKEIARLEQQKRGHGKQTFVLQDDGTLLVTVAQQGNIQHLSMPLVGWESTDTVISELREFARLRDDGILTTEEFEEKKRKLLATQNASSKMGFHP